MKIPEERKQKQRELHDHLLGDLANDPRYTVTASNEEKVTEVSGE